MIRQRLHNYPLTKTSPFSKRICRQRHRPTVEGVQVEPTFGFTFPEPQGVCRLGLISGNHDVVGNRQDLRLPSCPDRTSRSIVQPICATVKPHIICHIKTRKLIFKISPQVMATGSNTHLPWVQPWVRSLATSSARGRSRNLFALLPRVDFLWEISTAGIFPIQEVPGQESVSGRFTPMPWTWMDLPGMQKNPNSTPLVYQGHRYPAQRCAPDQRCLQAKRRGASSPLSIVLSSPD